MKLGQFLDKVDVFSDIPYVDIWAKDKVYTMDSPCGYIWKEYHVVQCKSRYDDEVEEYRDSTLESCYVGSEGSLEFHVK